MQVLPILHEQFCLLRPHPQLRQSHPWKSSLQHHCQVHSSPTDCSILKWICSILLDLDYCWIWNLNWICSGLLEIAANVITIFALLFLGRRLSVCGSMAIGQSTPNPLCTELRGHDKNLGYQRCLFTGGVTLFAVPYVDSVAGKAALAQIGRFAITGSFSMVSSHSNLNLMLVNFNFPIHGFECKKSIQDMIQCYSDLVI